MFEAMMSAVSCEAVVDVRDVLSIKSSLANVDVASINGEIAAAVEDHSAINDRDHNQLVEVWTILMVMLGQ